MSERTSNGPRWRRRPDGSNWGDFGPDDQLGRLNLLTPAKVLQGISEVHEGKTFCLSLPLDLPGGTVLSPSRFPPILRPTLRNGAVRMNYRSSRDNPTATEIVCDDVAILHTQYSTQWDSLAHAGYLFDADDDGVVEPVYYNGYRAGVDIVGPNDPSDAGIAGCCDLRSTSHAHALGIEHMATTGVQGRGVLIDLHAHFGRQQALVGYDDLMEVMRTDGVVVEPGDMVCLHTGFAQVIVEMGGKPDPAIVHTTCAALDGRDPELLNWITQSGLAVLIADNLAVEQLPARVQAHSGAQAPLHEHCLFKLGIHLGELWHLTPLADWLRSNRKSRFLLTAPPLRLPGAVGSPVTPVATV